MPQNAWFCGTTAKPGPRCGPVREVAWKGLGPNISARGLLAAECVKVRFDSPYLSIVYLKFIVIYSIFL